MEDGLRKIEIEESPTKNRVDEVHPEFIPDLVALLQRDILPAGTQEDKERPLFEDRLCTGLQVPLVSEARWKDQADSSGDLSDVGDNGVGVI